MININSENSKGKRPDAQKQIETHCLHRSTRSSLPKTKQKKKKKERGTFKDNRNRNWSRPELTHTHICEYGQPLELGLQEE
jgi:hypothetical protein